MVFFQSCLDNKNSMSFGWHSPVLNLDRIWRNVGSVCRMGVVSSMQNLNSCHKSLPMLGVASYSTLPSTGGSCIGSPHKSMRTFPPNNSLLPKTLHNLSDINSSCFVESI